MGKGGTSITMPEQPTYSEGMAEALKAQVELLTGKGEFEDIAPEGLAGLVPLEAEVRQLTTAADTAALKTALFGGRDPDAPKPTGGLIETEADRYKHYVKSNVDLEEWFNNKTAYGGTVYTSREAFGRKHYTTQGEGEGRVLGAKGEFLEYSPGDSGGTRVTKSDYDARVEKGKGEPTPGLIELMGSMKPITEGRSEQEELKFELLESQQGTTKGVDGVTFKMLNPSDQQTYDALKAKGPAVTRQPGFDEDGNFLGLTSWGEDLRQQAATTQRSADIADVEENLSRFQAIMEEVSPATTTMLDDAFDVIEAQGNRLIGGTPTFEEWQAQGKPGYPEVWIPEDPPKDPQEFYNDLIASGELKGEGFTISNPSQMEALAVEINRGDTTQMSASVREIAAQLSPDTAPKATQLGADKMVGEQISLQDRPMADQLAGRTRDPLEQMALETRGPVDQMTGFQDLGMTGLRQSLQGQAAADLAAGRGLSDRQRTDAIQTAREGWEARGRVRDPAAVVAEVEAVMEAQGAEEARRRAFAGGVVGQEAGLLTGELGRGMAQAEFNIQNEVARQEANLGRSLTAQEFNLINEAARQRENIGTQTEAERYNIGQEVARQEQNLGRRLTEQEFNALSKERAALGNIEREIGTEQFNIQNEIARQEAKIGRKLTADEFNTLNEIGRQQEKDRQGLLTQEFNIGQEVARDESNIARQMQGGMMDVGTQMDQERLNEQLRQQGILGYMGGVTQLAGLEQQQQQNLDPFATILNRPAGTTGFGMGQQAFAGGQYGLTSAPQYINPEAGLGYISNMASNQANMYGAQQAAQATKQAGIFGGLGALGGGIATGLLMRP